jgi:hypothetical protein
MNAIKSSRAISRVNAVLKTNVSETRSVSILRVNCGDRASLRTVEYQCKNTYV